MKAHYLLVFLVFGTASCNFVKGAPSVDAKIDVVSQYNFRGVVQNEKPVIQPSASVRAPLSEDSGVGASVWANGNFRDSTGDAAHPDGDGQSFSEIDLTATYYQRIGEVEYSLGLVSYSYPSVQATVPSQVDVFATAEWEGSGWGNALSGYQSLNDFGGLYLRADFTRGWSINRRMGFDLGLGVGYSDEDNSLYYYNATASGLSDVSATGSLTYAFDKRTSGTLFVSAIQVINDALEAALVASRIETENLVFGVSMSWAY